MFKHAAQRGGLLVLCWLAGGQVLAQQSTSTPLQQSGIAVERLDEEASRAIARAFDYDATIPLESRVVEKVKKDDLTREKVVFRGVQGFLVPAYLQLPPDAAGPFPCVLLMHGWSGSKEDWWRDGNYVSGGNLRQALLAAGFAVMAIDAQCHGDRIVQNDFAPVNHFVDESAGGNPRKGYFTQSDIYVQTVRNTHRAIDYLTTRAEIDNGRIGVVGYSMGGTQTFLLTGVEPRAGFSGRGRSGRKNEILPHCAAERYARHRRSSVLDDHRAERRFVFRGTRPRRAIAADGRREGTDLSGRRS